MDTSKIESLDIEEICQAVRGHAQDLREGQVYADLTFSRGMFVLEFTDYEASATVGRKTTGSGPIPPYVPSPSGVLQEPAECIVGDEKLIPVGIPEHFLNKQTVVGIDVDR